MDNQVYIQIVLLLRHNFDCLHRINRARRERSLRLLRMRRLNLERLRRMSMENLLEIFRRSDGAMLAIVNVSL